MAKLKYSGGTRSGKISQIPDTRDQQPRRVSNLVTQRVREKGISTSLYQVRQTNRVKNSSTWVYEQEGNV